MAINVPLLQQTLGYIEAHPQTWEQRTYRCGTGMCFAGWASELAGGKWLTSDPDDDYAEYLLAEPGEPFAQERQGTLTVSVESRARRVLGLDEEQADDLFYGYNNRDDMRSIVAGLCAEAES